MIGFNKDLEKTQLLSGMLTPATDQKAIIATVDVGDNQEGSTGKNCDNKSNIKLK